MALTLQWVGQDQKDRVAEARMRCYAGSSNQIERFKETMVREEAAGAAEYLLAERDGRAVGTTTGWALNMWVRGSRVSCQGVAYVGTIKTERRKGPEPVAGGRPPAGNSGVATELMRQTVQRARDRGLVTTALMPFRASFYEHFGYGLVERRSEWTVPLSVLPGGDFRGIRFYEPADLPEMKRLRQQTVECGQCDIERLDAWWDQFIQGTENGFVAVDQPGGAGPVRSWLYYTNAQVNGRDIVRVNDIGFDSIDSFRRQLHFLGSLRDQYWGAAITLPVDWPLNWMLKERQVPHRQVNHPTAELKQLTRMQVRVLDHHRFLEGMKLPAEARGEVVVAVHEVEGHVSKFQLRVEAGHVVVHASDASPQVECTDRVWAAIACGDLRAGEAARLGLIEANDPRAIATLDWLAAGPVPFCQEYF